ncbi:MAG TPA: DUF4167 domain-containing protein [Magnetospirillum sp.]|nr:DUF4167 domain-containing protein [Magnetospirillum sp.]
MNPKQRSRGRGNNGGNPNRGNFSSGGHGGGGHGGGGGGPRHINVRTQVFDSNGPEGRIRGNAHQVMEKYLALARDASSQGDRVAAENFYQHAEHYFRLINAYNQNNGQRRPQNLPTPAEDQNEMVGDDEEGDEQAASAPAGVPAQVEAEDVVSEAEPVSQEAEEAQPERAERPRRERAPRGERVERAERPEGERTERGAERGERPERRPRRPRQSAQPAAEAEEGNPPEPVSV